MSVETCAVCEGPREGEDRIFCPACRRSFDRWRTTADDGDNRSLIEWAAKRARAPFQHLHYHGVVRDFASAFTVLACAKCRWRVWLEAHHNHEGRRLSSRRLKLRKPLSCPKCGCPDWHYVRTEAAFGRKVHGFTGTFKRGSWKEGK